MKNNNKIHGYKVFNPDWTCNPTGCNPKQYTCPGKFEEEGELDVCGHGMHFCQTAADCFNYYNFDSNNKVAEVIAKAFPHTDWRRQSVYNPKTPECHFVSSYWRQLFRMFPNLP